MIPMKIMRTPIPMIHFPLSLFILQNYKEGVYQKGNPMPRL
jgi:hypothetical protein